MSLANLIELTRNLPELGESTGDMNFRVGIEAGGVIFYAIEAHSDPAGIGLLLADDNDPPKFFEMVAVDADGSGRVLLFEVTALQEVVRLGRPVKLGGAPVTRAWLDVYAPAANSPLAS